MGALLWLMLALVSLVIANRLYDASAPAWLILLTVAGLLGIAGLARRHRAVLLSYRYGLLVVAVLAYTAAWNRGLPILYAFSAILLAIWLLGMLLPRFSLQPVIVHRSYSASAVEGEDFEMSIALHNTGRRTMRLLEVADAITNAKPMAFVARLLPDERKNLHYRVKCGSRGVYPLGPLRLATGFPLGLTHNEITVANSGGRLIVYPRTYPIQTIPLYGAARQSWLGVPSPHPGAGDDFAGVREYRTGDSLRHIHWRASARHNELIVREFERRGATTVTVFLDLEQKACLGERGETTLDYAARIAASIACHALQHGHGVQMMGMGQQRQFLGRVEGPNSREAVLYFLAAVEPDGSTRFERMVCDLAWLAPEHSTAILIPTLLPGTLLNSAIEVLRQRGILCVIVGLEGHSFQQGGIVGEAQAAMHGQIDYPVRQGDDLSKVFML